MYRERTARGEQVWCYTSLASFVFDYPNLFIDARAQSQRVIPWLAFRYGITGLLYWQTVFAYRQEGDPWSKPRLMMTNGNGMEDYEYLALLDRRGDGKLAARLARVVASGSLQWSHDVSVLARTRETAAERLAAAGD